MSKKRGSPWLNDNGQWEIQFSQGGRRIHRVLPKGQTRDQAQKLQTRLRREAFDADFLNEIPDYTIGKALMKYLAEVPLKSRKKMGVHVQSLAPFVIGKTLKQIVSVAETVKKSRISRVKNRTPKPLSDSTINKRIYILKVTAKRAYKRWGLLREPLYEKIEFIPGGSGYQGKFFTRLQIAAILKGIRSGSIVLRKEKRVVVKPKARQIARAVLGSLYTGLREGEMLALNPDDFTGDALILRDSKNSKPALVPVVPWARWVFKKLPFDVHASTLSHAVSDHVRGRYHDLRHTFGSWLLQNGEPIEIVSKLMRHSSVTVTSKIYSHILIDVQRETANRGFAKARARKERAA